MAAISAQNVGAVLAAGRNDRLAAPVPAPSAPWVGREGQVNGGVWEFGAAAVWGAVEVDVDCG